MSIQDFKNMGFRANDLISFGQYSGLTIQQIYQGSPSPSREASLNYLASIIDDLPEVVNVIDPSFDDIRSCSIIGNFLHCKPVWAEPEFAKSKEVNADVSDILTAIVSYFFKPDFRGTVESFASYCSRNELITPTSGNPEYLKWLIREELIEMDQSDKNYLMELPVARIKGFNFFNLGNHLYDFYPEVLVERFSF